MKALKFYAIAFLCIILLYSCDKEFLEKKPDKALLVPQTIEDLQALLDNTSVMNTFPSYSLLASDDYFTTDNGWKAYNSPLERNTYIWAEDMYEGNPNNNDWNRPYQQIFYANVVLESLETFQEAERDLKWSQLKGSALFYRSMAFYNLAQTFAKPFDKNTAASDPGLPLHLTADVNDQQRRSTVQATYDQVLKDLKVAADLLPPDQSFRNRPSKTAAHGLLARVCQTMESYDMAVQYADITLKANDKLLDFNLLNPSAGAPFPMSLPNGNEEVIFYSTPLTYTFFSNSTLVDTLLYKSYSIHDLRRVLFFNNVGVQNVAGLTGKNYTGITTAEMYLIRAEGHARKENITAALSDLNTLLVKRYKKGFFIPQTAKDPEELLKLILDERRKELVSKGLRWTDLRRLNKDSRFKVTIKRFVNGQSFELLPSSNRYTFPIPQNEITASGITQNPR